MCLDYNSTSYTSQRARNRHRLTGWFDGDALPVGDPYRRCLALPAAVLRRQRRAGARQPRNPVDRLRHSPSRGRRYRRRCPRARRRGRHPPCSPITTSTTSSVRRASPTPSCTPPPVAAALTTDIAEVRAHAISYGADPAELDRTIARVRAPGSPGAERGPGSWRPQRACRTSGPWPYRPRSGGGHRPAGAGCAHGGVLRGPGGGRPIPPSTPAPTCGSGRAAWIGCWRSAARTRATCRATGRWSTPGSSAASGTGWRRRG